MVGDYICVAKICQGHINFVPNYLASSSLSTQNDNLKTKERFLLLLTSQITVNEGFGSLCLECHHGAGDPYTGCYNLHADDREICACKTYIKAV